MFHYIYKVVSENGKYYIGRHSTNKLNDGYMGSGMWIRNHKNTEKLEKIVIEFCETFDDLLLKEEKYISEHIEDPNNMNFNNSSVGASTGSMNISHRSEVKEKLRERMKTDNPMKHGHTKETKEKIRCAMLGEKNHFFGKGHSIEAKEKISLKNSGKVWTEEQRRNLSEVRKLQFDGEKPNYLFCSEHTTESKEKIRQSALNREKVICPHCQTMAAPHTAKRWHFDNCKQKTEMGL
jgi:hypothetical protein